jgi:hypothetical protein
MSYDPPQDGTTQTSPYISGFFYIPTTETANSTGVAYGNIIVLVPFWFPGPITIDSLAVWTNSAGTSARLGLYTVAPTDPVMTKVADSGSVALNSASDTILDITNYSVSAGTLLFTAYTPTSGNPNIQSVSASGGVEFLGMPSGLNNQRRAYQVNYSAGTLPATINKASLQTAIGSGQPYIWVRAA